MNPMSGRHVLAASAGGLLTASALRFPISASHSMATFRR